MSDLKDDELLVEEIQGEVMVYDTTGHRAYCLTPPQATEWRSIDRPSRRRVLRTGLTLAGAAVLSIVAPRPAEAGMSCAGPGTVVEVCSKCCSHNCLGGGAGPGVCQ
jgi:hypothetical protein